MPDAPRQHGERGLVRERVARERGVPVWGEMELGARLVTVPFDADALVMK